MPTSKLYVFDDNAEPNWNVDGPIQVDATFSTGDINTYTLDWGDGTVIGPQASSTFTGHTYAAPGEYAVTLTVVGPGGTHDDAINLLIEATGLQGGSSGGAYWTTSRNTGFGVAGAVAGSVTDVQAAQIGFYSTGYRPPPRPPLVMGAFTSGFTNGFDITN